MSQFLLFCIILLLLITNTISLNVCGGERDLQDTSVGEICDSGGYTDCPFGTTTCSQDLNAILCLPNCSITVRMVLEKNDTLVIPKCENGGYWDFFTEKCVCGVSFSGGLCQIKDECYGVDCNGHGTCFNGKCVCDSDYTGPSCEIHKNCRSFNVIWTGTECQCANGWTGKNCDQCLNTTICVPNKDMIGFTLLNIQNEYLRKSLIETAAPPSWSGMQPYKPTPDNYQCQCMSFNAILATYAPSSSLIEGIVDVSRISRLNQGIETLDSNHNIHPYIEEFFEHHHHIHHLSHVNNNPNVFLFIGFIIFIFILFGIIYYLYLEKNLSLKSKRRPSSIKYK